MRILFDALSLGARPSGTRTRLLGLVPELLRRGGPELAVACGPGLTASERAALAGATLCEVDRPPASPLGRAVAQRRIWRDLRRRFPFDLAVVDCLPFPGGVPAIGVVHDLRHLGGRGARRLVARSLLARGLRACVRVHTVSKAVAAELEAAIPEVAGKLHVVPNGVSIDRFHPAAAGDAAILARFGLARPYVVCVGHLEPRKGVDVALEVRSRLAEAGIDLGLVFVGKGELLPEESLAWLRQRHPEQEIGRVLRGVGPEELPALVRGARALLAPASLEGFGMAPLEALACGTPVVASDIPAHREVLGPAVLYAPPGDAPAFQAALLRLLGDDLLRETLVASGLNRARGLTWERAAEAFLAGLPADPGDHPAARR